MLYFLKAVGSRISNITLWVVNWSTFVWSTRPGQKRTDQDREEFNLADLILELAFLFVWDFFAQGNLVFTGKFRGKEIESFFRSGRFLGKLKRGRNACRWSTAPPSLLLRPVVPQFKPTTTDLQCRCSPICNYVHGPPRACRSYQNPSHIKPTNAKLCHEHEPVTTGTHCHRERNSGAASHKTLQWKISQNIWLHWKRSGACVKRVQIENWKSERQANEHL